MIFEKMQSWTTTVPIWLITHGALDRLSSTDHTVIIEIIIVVLACVSWTPKSHLHFANYWSIDKCSFISNSCWSPFFPSSSCLEGNSGTNTWLKCNGPNVVTFRNMSYKLFMLIYEIVQISLLLILFKTIVKEGQQAHWWRFYPIVLLRISDPEILKTKLLST